MDLWSKVFKRNNFEFLLQVFYNKISYFEMMKWQKNSMNNRKKIEYQRLGKVNCKNYNHEICSVHTGCFTDLGKLNLPVVVQIWAQANFCYCPNCLKKWSSLQKAVKIDSILIIPHSRSKFVKRTVHWWDSQEYVNRRWALI